MRSDLTSELGEVRAELCGGIKICLKSQEQVHAASSFKNCVLAYLGKNGDKASGKYALLSEQVPKQKQLVFYG